MKVKDYIVGIGSVDTKWAKHEEVVRLVRQANLALKLVLITPLTRAEVTSGSRLFSTVSLPTSPVKAESQSQTAATERERKITNRISAPWLFVRKSSGKEKNGPPSRPVSMSSPLINGSVKHFGNGNMKSGHFLHGADVEL
ncbi:unnamed protein product [Candidula unifasciata]|uniref:Uncharacterized protein n=1 Tax=Candidula unifasciata TaxID=100452 RepID=A0A8S3ZCJ1_9EUPU|nr:unnamed protein product [Candidula unifasciata]